MANVQHGDGRRNGNRAESSFSTSGISGNATVQNAGGHIINGDYTVHQTALKDEIDRHVFHDMNARMKNVQHCLDKREVLKWIYMIDSDTSLSFNAAQKVHLSGTGSWFLDGSQFSEWKAQPGSVLWLYGGPGSGKTVLSCGVFSPHLREILSDNCASYSAIKDIINVCELRPLVRGYAYFFFDARNDKLQDFAHEKFARSLITQLADRCGDEIPAALVSMYRACDNGHRQPPLISLEETLLQVLECFEDVYIVLDSLDECAEKSDLLNWIESVTSKASGKLHLMATSRPESKIEQGLASLSGNRIRKVLVTDSSTESDISAFFNAQLAKMAKWKNLEGPRIKTAILPRSGGMMFRWVALQLHDISKCSSKKALYEQLESLPKGLDETYARIFKRSEHPDILLKFLQWLAFSQREMTVKELAEVAAVDLSRADSIVYDLNMRYEEPAEVLNICYGLVTEVEGIIKLAHFSVKEYLIKHIQPPPGRTSAQLSHSVIAQTCLAHLLYFDQPSVITWSQNIKDSRRRIHALFPLSGYAAAFWVSHFHSASADATDGPRLLKLLQGLFAPPQSYAMSSWVLLHDPHSYSDRLSHNYEIYLDDTASPLHYACVAGLTELVMHLIEEGADINEIDTDYIISTPLLAAIKNGHLELAKLLLEKGADANVAGEHYGTALQAASEGGHLDLAELLLNKGANVNAKEGASLQVASAAGHLELAKLLLEHGADVHVAGRNYGTLLQEASVGGYFELVKVLLEKGAIVDAKGGTLSVTDLQAASLRGHIGIVKLLLEHGADVNITGGRHGTALQAASEYNHLDIVKLLLENGAEVNIMTHYVHTALQAASAKGHLELGKLLLEHGADVNIAGGMALREASKRGHVEIAKLLLEHGADVDANEGELLWEACAQGHLELATLLLLHGADVDTNGGELLRAACDGGHLELATLLLEHGADVDGNEGELLRAASKAGHLKIAKLLLEHGADVNIAGGTALWEACAQGHLELATLLLLHGADENIATEYGHTALWGAYKGGHLDIVKLLLEHGVDLHVMGGTVLRAACAQGHLELAKMLLDRGVDVDVASGTRHSPLWKASEGGHHEISKLLLEHGADVDANEGELLRAASHGGCLELVMLLLLHGADANIATEYGHTALWEASKGGHLEIAKLLLEHGVDLNVVGGTALRAACAQDHLELTMLLLNHGVNIDIPRHSGEDITAEVYLRIAKCRLQVSDGLVAAAAHAP